jgi:uncharacterized protein (TIGR02118 family)
VSKVIFVLHRKPELTLKQCSKYWAGEQHTSTVRKIPGLTGWVQNHVLGQGAPACDGVGELWFDDDQVMQTALASAEMAAAIEDAKNFLDMERTGMLIVEERRLM